MQRVGGIKRVVDGKVYNMETAEPLHTFEPIDDLGDFHYFIETLSCYEEVSLFRSRRGRGDEPILRESWRR